MIYPAVVFSLLLFFFAVPAAEAENSLLSGEELSGLDSLRSSLGIRYTDWPQNADPCLNWTGIVCRSGRVVSLDLTGLRRNQFNLLRPLFAIDGVRNLTGLERFVASNFVLRGQIPDWLFSGDLPSLSFFVLKSAAILGEIPYSLGLAVNLRVLSLSDNSITGNIPPTLGNLLNLTSLDLSKNLLSSSIPPELGSLLNLSYLNLSSNYLSGTIPSSFGTLSKLKTLSLAGNSLEGVVPDILGNLSLLESLDLSSNSLADVLPEIIFYGASHLRFVNLSDNYFDGPIPNSTWSLPYLEYFDASSNNLTGSFPESIPSMNLNVSGQLFNMSANLYYGLLPPGTGFFLRRFTAVDLSKNYLKGSEPLRTKGDKIFHYGFNCFSDATNQRSSGDCEAFYEDRNIPFLEPDPLFQSLDSSQPNRNSIHGWINIMIVVLVVTVVLIAIPPLVFLCLRRSRNQRNSQGVLVSSSKFLESLPEVIGESFSYQQLVRATSDFSSRNLIKSGHSGNLYRGTLKDNNSVVVKKIDFHAERDVYPVELDLFSKDLNGRLVPFVGHCLEKENQKFLIYKFMPYGDLSMALFRAPKTDEGEGLRSLDWITRLKVATGVAEALCFLHHECNPPLVHRDIQSSSILLDEKYEVRLGSLSEVCAQEGESHSSVISRMLRRQQTPELGISANGSTRSPATCAYDVYCLGKVMLELITGNLGISSSAGMIDTEWMDQSLPYIDINNRDLITKIVDPTLMVDDDLLEEVWAMAIMARCCLNPRPNKRPLARHLLKALQNPVKVVREETFSSSDPSRSNSFHHSWVGALLGGLLHGSPEMAPVSG